MALRKQLVDRDKAEMSICKQCELLEIPRSTLYYTPSKSYNDKDLEAMKALDELYLEDPTRGTRRMSKELCKREFKIGRQHTRRLMQLMRLKTVYCRPRTTIMDPAKYKFPYLLRNLSITRPNQVWGIDITYIPMPKGFMYMFAIIDLYSRFIVGWSLSNSMEAEWVVETIKVAINKHGKPEIINSDQGSQFTSDEYVKYIKSLKTVKISMDGKGRAIDNVYIERFWRTIKYDKIYLVNPETPTELNKECKEFIQYYNLRRDHSSIGDLTPEQVYKQAA